MLVAMSATPSHVRPHDEGGERPDAEATPVGPGSQPVASVPRPVARPSSSHEHKDTDADLALELLRGLADQEIARSERSASRARQVFALTVAFFAVVQTVAFGSFATTLIGHHERKVMLSLAG